MPTPSHVTLAESAPSASPKGVEAPTPGTPKKRNLGDGFDAQEAALVPEALLTERQVEDALRFNRKHRGKPTFVTHVQSYFGVAATGRFDTPTVHAVANYQVQKGLTVDGMVGPQTKSKLSADGADVSPPTETTSEHANASPHEANAPLTEVSPPPAPTPEQEVKAQTTHTPTAPPMSFGEGRTLSIAELSTWAEATATHIEAGLAQLAAMDPADAALEASLTREAGALEAAGDALRTRAIQLINDASLLKRPEAQPTLPTRPELLAFSAAIRRIGKAGAAMAQAEAVCLDAVLAIQQGASVLSARATWAEKPREAKGAAEVATQEKAKDDPLNAIFKDSGFANRITTVEGTDKIADWCGMFVGASLFRGGGLDEELRQGMLHTSNVLDYFQYQQVANAGRVPKSIWADGAWHDMKTYHGARGSQRQWQSRATVTTVMEGGGPLDVRPGDVVLIDHSGNKKAPQHITMVESYDPATHQLTTIEGNTSGIRPANDGKVGDAGDGYHEVNATGRDGSGLHTRDMTNMSAGSRATHADTHAANMERHKNAPQGAYRGAKGSTVFGIGRPSAVDFEEHEYATKAVPDALKHISPAEMDKKAKANVGVHNAK